VQYNQEAVRIQLGDTLLMDRGQPLPFDAKAASAYLKGKADVHGTVNIQVCVGGGWGVGGGRAGACCGSLLA
jgi:glutamate N-acetyltransferase/amino-acid N-acetyltransferase